MPRDYQNAPPAVTHPADSSAEAPSEHGMGQASPQPTSGVEGTAGAYEPVTPSEQPVTTTLPDTPVTTTT